MIVPSRTSAQSGQTWAGGEFPQPDDDLTHFQVKRAEINFCGDDEDEDEDDDDDDLPSDPPRRKACQIHPGLNVH